MGPRLLCYLIVFVAATGALADEQVRQVQEELRRRNLYFGDVDGQLRPELAAALKRYQARKGFPVTGTINRETATSLHVEERTGDKAAKPALPDVPVLRSDNARGLPEEQRASLAQKAEENPDAALATPAPPAEPPPPAPEFDRSRVHAVIEQYLRDSESQDIPAQTRYFSYPVEYFDHGAVDPAFVEKDVVNYVKRWPERKYVLEEPITLAASTRSGEIVVEFPITFDVRNRKHTARGRTRNFWTLKSEGGDWKIIAIREQRLRD